VSRGTAVKAAVVSRIRQVLAKPAAAATEDESNTQQENAQQTQAEAEAAVAVAARDVVLCVLARYSDVVDEITAPWSDEERRQAGEKENASFAPFLS
jgi:hypothetical protein